MAGNVALDGHLSGFRIHEHLAGVAAEEVSYKSPHALSCLLLFGHGRRLEDAQPFHGEAALCAFPGDFLEAHAFLRAVCIVGFSILDPNVVHQLLKAGRCDVLKLLLELGGSDLNCRACEVCLSCGGRAPGFRSELGVRQDGDDAIQRHSDLFGGDLRHHISEPLPHINPTGINLYGTFLREPASGPRSVGKAVPVTQAKADDAHAVAPPEMRRRRRIAAVCPVHLLQDRFETLGGCCMRNDLPGGDSVARADQVLQAQFRLVHADLRGKPIH